MRRVARTAESIPLPLSKARPEKKTAGSKMNSAVSPAMSQTACSRAYAKHVTAAVMPYLT
jgi:hypothetical protein